MLLSTSSSTPFSLSRCLTMSQDHTIYKEKLERLFQDLRANAWRGETRSCESHYWVSHSEDDLPAPLFWSTQQKECKSCVFHRVLDQARACKTYRDGHSTCKTQWSQAVKHAIQGFEDWQAQKRAILLISDSLKSLCKCLRSCRVEAIAYSCRD